MNSKEGDQHFWKELRSNLIKTLWKDLIVSLNAVLQAKRAFTKYYLKVVHISATLFPPKMFLT